MNDVGASLKLRMSGTLVCKGKDGQVLKEIPFSGDVTPKDLGLTEEQARQLAQGVKNDDLGQ